ncbi:hypothetical protein LEP1GSC062_1632 [Leptospira alexanderi serovar Manhao 3 str. L 60]|uniref:VCBS repeat protein n=1 Tax=Leptospira alexanderi serovar Manhao 3 str. L 60 TaxID=1049759 RepID=V6I5M5_9LEPT|nr:hypothetical protein LEP1GSC062_1632 [Leptospira alexanderi serovar Manhao 3 str. L 60]
MDDSGFSVLNSKRNRILSLPLKDSEGIKTFEFKDFNNDGYEDIFLGWSNLFVNDLRSLDLFIPSSGKFRSYFKNTLSLFKTPIPIILRYF